VKVHDPDLGVDIEMDAGGLQLEVDATTEDRFETVEFGGLEIEVPKLGLHGTSARGMCSPMRAGGC
jgi:hypothetical protein